MAQQRRERTGIGGTQALVDADGIDRRSRPALPTPRQIGLIHIAGRDVLEGSAYGYEKPLRIVLFDAKLGAARVRRFPQPLYTALEVVEQAVEAGLGRQ